MGIDQPAVGEDTQVRILRVDTPVFRKIMQRDFLTWRECLPNGFISLRRSGEQSVIRREAPLCQVIVGLRLS